MAVHGLRHFNADIPPSDDDNVLRAVLLNPFFQEDTAVKSIDSHDAVCLNSGNGGAHGDGPRCDQKFVPRLCNSFSRFKIGHFQSLAGRVYFFNLMTQLNVYVILFKFLFGSGDHVVPVIHEVAHVVGDPAGGVGNVRSLFEDDNLRLFFHSAQLGCRRHSCRIAADYKNLFRHVVLSSPVCVSCCIID